MYVLHYKKEYIEEGIKEDLDYITNVSLYSKQFNKL